MNFEAGFLRSRISTLRHLPEKESHAPAAGYLFLFSTVKKHLSQNGKDAFLYFSAAAIDTFCERYIHRLVV
ncbi:hypothetical protein CLOSTMETH_02685 [[Clostridium] methylpentosum DSM 5476]|uniref:Uncharacterized protein n=1 Tax=[Clostridium] methylpentosum DSM 5476 TaxID=537013 RepID=C0EFP3_9FIRM|nr:hypothetical protein CLOSTMETH_02685 [[Clostridium] methylpentosum DSM 5476]